MGKEWAIGGSDEDETGQPTAPAANENVNNDSYWKYASSSIQSAAESSYSTLTGMLSSIYTDSSTTAPPVLERRESPEDDMMDDLILPSLRKSSLAWMRGNPYNSVRGRHDRPSSMSAVRSFLTVVPSVDHYVPKLEAIPNEESMYYDEPITPSGHSLLEGSWSEKDFSYRKGNFYHQRKPVSDAETASQVAEGTIRALRDLALDEAVELHASLRYWSERWERPVLSWLEAGPSGTY